MGAGLGDAPAADDKDLVRAADGGQAVRHDEAGAPCQHRLDGVLDELFRLGVDAAGSLVQNEDARVGEDHAGEAHKLLLPCGKAAAALAHLCAVAVGQGFDEAVRPHHGGGALHLVQCGVLAAVADVVRNAAAEQVRRLQHIAQRGVQPELAALTVVHAVDEHLARGRFVKTAHQVDDGAFARARLAHQGDGLARLYL